MVKITGYRNYNCNFELVKQIIENAVTLEKIIIYTNDFDPDSKNQSEEDNGELQKK